MERVNYYFHMEGTIDNISTVERDEVMNQYTITKLEITDKYEIQGYV